MIDTTLIRHVHAGSGSEPLGASVALPPTDGVYLIKAILFIRNAAATQYKMFQRTALLRRAGTWSQLSFTDTILPTSGAPTWTVSPSFAGDSIAFSVTAEAGAISTLSFDGQFVGD